MYKDALKLFFIEVEPNELFLISTTILSVACLFIRVAKILSKKDANLLSDKKKKSYLSFL